MDTSKAIYFQTTIYTQIEVEVPLRPITDTCLLNHNVLSARRARYSTGTRPARRTARSTSGCTPCRTPTGTSWPWPTRAATRRNGISTKPTAKPASSPVPTAAGALRCTTGRRGMQGIGGHLRLFTMSATAGFQLHYDGFLEIRFGISRQPTCIRMYLIAPYR